MAASGQRAQQLGQRDFVARRLLGEVHELDDPQLTWDLARLSRIHRRRRQHDEQVRTLAEDAIDVTVPVVRYLVLDLVDPDGDPARLQLLGERQYKLLIGAGVADEDALGHRLKNTVAGSASKPK